MPDLPDKSVFTGVVESDAAIGEVVQRGTVAAAEQRVRLAMAPNRTRSVW
jgi:hypothetical protein